jgi:gluconokinase
MLADAGLDLAAGMVLDQGSVLFQRLTGTFATTAALASGTGLLGVQSTGWDPEVSEVLGLSAARLPELIDARAHAPLTSAGAALLDLPAGTPVLAPGPDGGLSQLGDEASKPGVLTFSMGTSGAMRLAVPTPVLSDRQSTWCYRSPDTWLSGAATSGCCNAVDWARVAFFGESTDFGALEAQLRPGQRDVPVFLPFLFGERCPGWHDQREGGFSGLTARHDTLDLYQAVLHGVVFNLLQCYEELRRLNGQPERIRLSGGVLSSPFWVQLTADVFGTELELSPQQHSSAMGAIRLGLSASDPDGTHPGLSSDPVRSVAADPALADYYQERYAAYLSVYEQTKTGA